MDGDERPSRQYALLIGVDEVSSNIFLRFGSNSLYADTRSWYRSLSEKSSRCGSSRLLVSSSLSISGELSKTNRSSISSSTGRKALRRPKDRASKSRTRACEVADRVVLLFLSRKFLIRKYTLFGVRCGMKSLEIDTMGLVLVWFL